MADIELPRKKILAIAQKLPATACVLGKLQLLLGDTDADLDDICELLKCDTVLAARILRISNSPYFGSATPNASLEEAVGCVGYREIYKLVGLTVSAQLFDKELAYYGYTARQLWENTLCTALAIESLAQFVGVNPRAAYTSGLLRSIGKIALNLLAAATLPAVATFPRSGRGNLGEWERTNWGCDSTGVTVLLLEEWSFSPETCAAVRGYHSPEKTPADEMGPCLLALAASVSHSLGFGLPGEEGDRQPHPVVFARTKLTARDLELCTDQTQIAFLAAQQAFADSPDFSLARDA